MTTTKLLYLDDEPINLELFKIHFGKKYNVFLAKDGLEGLDTLKHNNDINIIFSDMKMPNMNGLEFIEKARKKYPHKRYFILTGIDVSNEIKLALNNNIISNYFKKPFNIPKIEETIQASLS